MQRFLAGHAQGVKHFLLQFALEDPDRTSADLVSIQYHIVGICLDLRIRMFQVFSLVFDDRTIADHHFYMIRFGRSKRMMTRYPTVIILTVFKQWKIQYPQEFELFLLS